jgi:hypothetical protein
MKTVYDMSTGRILDPGIETHDTSMLGLTQDATRCALQLQLVLPESRPKRQLPPELVMADPNAFIDKMS